MVAQGVVVWQEMEEVGGRHRLSHSATGTYHPSTLLKVVPSGAGRWEELRILWRPLGERVVLQGRRGGTTKLFWCCLIVWQDRGSPCFLRARSFPRGGGRLDGRALY